MYFCTMILTELYTASPIVKQLTSKLESPSARVHINGLSGALSSVIGATIAQNNPQKKHLFILPDKEEAYYFLNNLETLFEETDKDIEEKRVLLFPTTYRRPYQSEEIDNANVLQRSEVTRRLAHNDSLLVVTYPDALCEKVVSQYALKENTLTISRGDKIDLDFVMDVLIEYDFERVDFVVEPGQYAVRGGIIDIFSFADEKPYRIEFFGDEIDSLRTFDPVTQLSVKVLDQVVIIPNMERNSTVSARLHDEKVSLLKYWGGQDVVWVQNLMLVTETIEKDYHTAEQTYARQDSPVAHLKPEQLYSSSNEFMKLLLACSIVEYGATSYFTKADILEAVSEPQPAFNKQFELLRESLCSLAEQNYTLLMMVANGKQHQRLSRVMENGDWPLSRLQWVESSLDKGFIDHTSRLVCYTDHEIFERYHKYTLRDLQQNREALTLKELFELKPGDYVTHLDYGVGKFSGLEKITNNGKEQEVIRLIYKNNDVLYISIHSLHKISRYVGREGVAPALNRLGSSSWQVLKQKTKKQVKDIARDLIALYAKRRASQGFAFSADSYLQNELEASFFYEDTPDQYKATRDVKHDMEDRAPMDRLVCGDVGFGKTEVAIRAAFKAVCDSKQVAVLVPATILAFQHYNTFTERLSGLPVRVEYLNRFRTVKEKNQIYKDLENGKIDILIGTHAITNSKLKFKDLGLLIIDEEQKFGVAVKEKLRQMKVNIDCLTLTATPIPRTLQFSMMGARDLSVIQTPPPNRQPIHTQLAEYDEEIIRDAIRYEVSRGGQVFFVSNRVENLPEMTGLVSRLVPDVRVAAAHGQMDGKKVEEILLQFMEGDIDVLVATTIIENGLDIPNANTMIINNAQNFGLSDLHQMRGRVGRSNRKAFCYMLVPSFKILTDEAQKRLKAIEEFSTIGSGFNIAMRDLDIRGAGNILGAEQSGFISDIGYDMYQKILDEAIEELKETDFKELFYQEAEEKKAYVKDCLIETDLEVLIPDGYVNNISERLLLYRELNDLTTEEDLEAYRQRLTDRFGPLPSATQELVSTITLRRIAKEFGIEKLVLKQGRLVCQFVSNQENPFYKSENFIKMIHFAQQNPTKVHLRETPERLTLHCDGVHSIRQAISCLTELVS